MATLRFQNGLHRIEDGFSRFDTGGTSIVLVLSYVFDWVVIVYAIRKIDLILRRNID